MPYLYIGNTETRTAKYVCRVEGGLTTTLNSSLKHYLLPILIEKAVTYNEDIKIPLIGRFTVIGEEQE